MPVLFAQDDHVKSDFELCKANVLKRYRAKTVVRDDALQEIKNCSAGSGSNLYKDCKKDQLKAKSYEGENCRKYLPVITVDPKSLIPFISKGDNGFFAGVNFAKSWTFESLKLKDFDCSKINHATVKNFRDAKFLMFGQDPYLFSGLFPSNQETPKVLPKKIAPQGLPVGTKAKILGDSTGPMLFFPILECTYNGKVRPPIKNMVLSFLINFAEERATPYFGTVHFEKLTVKTLGYGLDVLRTFGQPFKTLAKKASGATYLGSLGFRAYDSEGDPRDVCSGPKLDAFTILLKSQKNEETLDFASFISIKNLCSFALSAINSKE